MQTTTKPLNNISNRAKLHGAIIRKVKQACKDTYATTETVCKVLMVNFPSLTEADLGGYLDYANAILATKNA